MLKYGKYLKCLFNSFLSQLFSNFVLFCSPFLNSDYSFLNFSGNFLFADQRGILSNHRSYCASICIPLIGPHKINFLSVVIYSFHLREWAPLELEALSVIKILRQITLYVIYLVPFSAIEYIFKISLWYRTLLWNVFFTDNPCFILLYKRKTALSVNTFIRSFDWNDTLLFSKKIF